MNGRLAKRFSRRAMLKGGAIGAAGLGVSCLGLGLTDSLAGLRAPGVSPKASARRSPPIGPELVTTIDAGVQKALTQAVDRGAMDAGLSLETLRGAAVVVDVNRGDIIALDSRPAFQLGELADADSWAKAEAADRRAGFGYRHLDRVVDGSYPPGSVFKVVTALAALDSGLFQRHSPVFDYREGDKGPQRPDGIEQLGRWHQIRFEDGSAISCGNHPDLRDWRFDLETALAWSCNVAFAEITLAIGPVRLASMTQRLGFDKQISVPGLGAFRSTLDNDVDRPLNRRFVARSPGDLARTGFGQGQLLTCPLHMALIAAAVANGGKVMQPRLIDRWIFANGNVQQGTRPAVLFDAAIADSTAKVMQDIMHASTTYGWASYGALNTANVRPGLAAKTGSAEWGDNQDATHSWFIGYFPTEAPAISFAIIIERGGAGPTSAAGIGRQIISSSPVQQFVSTRTDDA